MAEAATPKPRNKIRTIRIWLWVITLLFAGMFFLSQCAMSKPQAKGRAFAKRSGRIQPLRAKAHMTQRDFGVSRQGRKVISRDQREGRRRGGQ